MSAYIQSTVRRSHGDSHAGRSHALDMDYLIETDQNTSLLNSHVVRTFALNEHEHQRSAREVAHVSPMDMMTVTTPAQNSRDSLFYSEHSGNRRTLPTRSSDPFRY